MAGRSCKLIGANLRHKIAVLGSGGLGIEKSHSQSRNHQNGCNPLLHCIGCMLHCGSLWYTRPSCMESLVVKKFHASCPL